MTKTQLTDAFRNIKKQIVPWISVVVIGTVALVAYLSLVYSAAAINRSISGYYEKYRLWDLEISSTMLMDDEDLQAIRALPGVELAEPVWRAEVYRAGGSKEDSAAVQSLPQEISLPELLDGRLPTSAGECAVEQYLFEKWGLALGDQLSVECAPVAGIDPLRVKDYVVTGVFRHPDHISFQLSETPYLLVTPDCFDHEALDGAFMKTRIRVADTPADRYSSAYMEAVRPVSDALAAIEPERTAARSAAIRAVYERQISEGQEKLDEASAKLESAQKQLDDARQQLDDGWNELQASARKLAAAKKQLDDGARALGEAEYKIEAIPLLLRGIMNSLTYEQLDLLPDEAREVVSQYREGVHQFSVGRMNWYAAGEEYLDGLTLYEQGRKKLEQGEIDYENGLREYESGKAEYDKSVRQLADARRQMDQLGECRWLVLNDYGNAGYSFAENQASGLSSLSYSFSLIFLIIAALVIYASVGRMVQEQRALVGTSKALGLFNREILGKYMIFGVSAGVAAAALGVVLSYFVVQKSLLGNYGPLFTLGSFPSSFLPWETLIVVVLLPVISAISVWFACSGLLRIPAIRLLNGEELSSRRKAGSRSGERGLYTRLIFRNMQTDLRRVIVTTISISGCCMLLVVGFSIKYAIERVNARQFGQVIQFQAEIYYDPAEQEAAPEICRILEDKGLPYAQVRRSGLLFRSGDKLYTGTAIVSEPEALTGFYGLKAADSKADICAADSGVLIPSRMSTYFKLLPGDVLQAYSSSLEPKEIPVTGVFNNHFGHLLFFTPAGYQAIFGTAAEDNCFLVRLDNMSLDELEQALSGIAGFDHVRDAAAERERFNSFSSILNMVIVLLLGLAGVMAYFIVMNLSVTYIQKKTRELTVMRINGFTVRECVTYVSWDLIVTTLLGTLLGLVVGHFLALLIIPVPEGPYMQFVHDPDLRTYLFSALITIGFSALISGAALRRVKFLKLSDIN